MFEAALHYLLFAVLAVGGLGAGLIVLWVIARLVFLAFFQSRNQFHAAEQRRNQEDF